ncbi:hypothetical protein CQA53_03020 [Helicobacter didelphidarum]|uniref:Peptidase n=1 Tax=Helicobacter didelphidarum TaxID=2040648 RepID=A0A3D8IPC5_9HELI|nr:EI24 domain-containing protein [Helicobacter didelphidarum]RDU66756.1 hypothetical protein CQA53_03020 [Helicobacter didelphidarum]
MPNSQNNFFIFHYLRQATQSMRYKKIIFLTLIPAILAVCVWWIFFVLSVQNFHWFLQQFPNIWVEYAYSHTSFMSQVSYYLLYLFAIFTMLIYGVILSGICMIFASCFLSPFVVNFVHTTYFSHVIINPPPFIESCKLSSIFFLKTLIRFLVFSFLCYGLSFIGLGLIGLILSVFVYFRFFSLNLNYEIVLSIMNEQDCKNCLSSNKIPLFILNIIIFIPLYVPILNLFVMTWQMLVLSHYVFDWYAQYKCHTHDDYIIEAEVIEIEPSYAP